MHQNCLLLFDKHARQFVSGTRSVLEIGPDRFPSSLQQACRATHSGKWDTLDIRSRNPAQTFVSVDEHRFPIEDNRYDVVLAANVLEHVRKPWLWVRECSRVLRDGGSLILVSPASWPYHEFPIDCWRFYPEAMNALLTEAGCDVVLSLCASEEAARYGIARPVPGLGLDYHFLRFPGAGPEDWRTHLRRFAKRRLAPYGFPVQCAYDTIAVGLKKT